MIPESSIQAWREFAPWAEAYQVEQDLVLTRAVIEFYNDPLLKGAFAFRGGTALQKLFYDPPLRYSEDIDLVQIRQEPIGPAIDAIRVLFDPWLGKPRRDRKQDRVTLMYRFQSEVPPVQRMRLKIGVNNGEHFTVLNLQKRKLNAANPWFTGSTEISTYEIEELLGTKLRALFDVKGPRPFDMATALDHFPDLDAKKVIHCFQKYMEHENTEVTRAQFEANLVEKLGDPAFTDDSRFLLAPNVPHFDPQTAGEKIQSAFLSLLPGSPWKGKEESHKKQKARRLVTS